MALPTFTTSKLGILQMQLNIALSCGYLLLATAIVAPQKGFVDHRTSLFLTGIAFIGGWRLMSGIQALIDRFKPESALEAKRLNEQLKLLANMMNTVAAASVSVLAIAEIAKNPTEPNMLLIAAAVGAGLWVNMGARGLLLHLKEDAAAAYANVSTDTPSS